MKHKIQKDDVFSSVQLELIPMEGSTGMTKSFLKSRNPNMENR